MSRLVGRGRAAIAAIAVELVLAGGAWSVEPTIGPTTAPPAQPAPRGIVASDLASDFAVDPDLLSYAIRMSPSPSDPPSGRAELDLLSPTSLAPPPSAGRFLSRQWFASQSSSTARDLVLLVFDTVEQVHPFVRPITTPNVGGPGRRTPRAPGPLVGVDIPLDLVLSWW